MLTVHTHRNLKWQTNKKKNLIYYLELMVNCYVINNIWSTFVPESYKEGLFYFYFFTLLIVFALLHVNNQDLAHLS